MTCQSSHRQSSVPVQRSLRSATKETSWGGGSNLAHPTGGDKSIRRESCQVERGPPDTLFQCVSVSSASMADQNLPLSAPVLLAPVKCCVLSCAGCLGIYWKKCTQKDKDVKDSLILEFVYKVRRAWTIILKFWLSSSEFPLTFKQSGPVMDVGLLLFHAQCPSSS